VYLGKLHPTAFRILGLGQVEALKTKRHITGIITSYTLMEFGDRYLNEREYKLPEGDTVRCPASP
jgi:hypothetical protein